MLAGDAITIWNLNIPKPEIPPAIAANYRQVKIEWTKQLVARQKQLTEKINKETSLQNSIMDAERDRKVQQIEDSVELINKENEERMGNIENEIKLQRENTNSDIETYYATTQAEYNKNLLTDQFIKLELSKSLLANTKVFFSGQNSLLGSALHRILSPPEDE